MKQREKTYLVSGGIPLLLQNRHGLSISKTLSEGIESIEEEYFGALSNILTGYEDSDGRGPFQFVLKFISGKEIDAKLGEFIRSSERKRPLITFDDVYCTDLPDGHYSITRTMNPQNLESGTSLGPRLRSPPLYEQAMGIRKRFGKEIDIMDIGTFEGETLCGEVETRFKDLGIKVVNAYFAFAGEEGKQNLVEAGIKPFSLWTHDWVDWLEIRDCLGFDGRKVSMEGTHDSRILNQFIPYALKPEQWASIPPKFVTQFKELYFEFFDRISRELKVDGCYLVLEPSKDNSLVMELRRE